MTVETRIIQTVKLNLSLPVFSVSETEEADLMNYFFEKLGEKISAYAESSSQIRRYSANFSLSEEDGILIVTFQLCARVLDNFGELRLHKRELCTVWNGAKLNITVS